MRRRPRWARLLGIGVVLLAVGNWPVAGRTVRPPQTPPPLRVQVRYGDSLWTLARRYGDPRRDVRETVAKMMAANQLDPGRLQPGQEIVLPAECLAAR